MITYLYHVILYHVILYHIILCYIILNYIILYYKILYYIIHYILHNIYIYISPVCVCCRYIHVKSQLFHWHLHFGHGCAVPRLAQLLLQLGALRQQLRCLAIGGLAGGSLADSPWISPVQSDVSSKNHGVNKGFLPMNLGKTYIRGLDFGCISGASFPDSPWHFEDFNHDFTSENDDLSSQTLWFNHVSAARISTHVDWSSKNQNILGFIHWQ